MGRVFILVVMAYRMQLELKNLSVTAQQRVSNVRYDAQIRNLAMNQELHSDSKMGLKANRGLRSRNDE